jgi:hypothetical protein
MCNYHYYFVVLFFAFVSIILASVSIILGPVSTSLGVPAVDVFVVVVVVDFPFCCCRFAAAVVFLALSCFTGRTLAPFCHPSNLIANLAN